MTKYIKTLVTISFAFVIFIFFSGFESRSLKNDLTEILYERSVILGGAYFAGVSYESTEELLSEIETSPLIAEDLNALALWEDTDMDRVKDVSVKNIEVIEKNDHEIILTAKVEWTMEGMEFNYVDNDEYCFVLNEINGRQILANMFTLV